MTCSRECVILAGLGGMTPTLARLASTYVTDPSTPPPATGLFIGLVLFFFLAGILAYAFSESNIKQAFILGVCAPGIITNIVAGAEDSRGNRFNTRTAFGVFLVQTAEAQSSTKEISKSRAASGIDNVIELSGRRLTLVPYIAGSPWALRRLAVSVDFLDKTGKSIGQTVLVSLDSAASLQLPSQTVSVKVEVGDQTVRQSLPSQPFSSATLALEVAVEGTNDFTWAFGGTRRPTVAKLNSRLESVALLEESIQARQILGRTVKDSSGKVIGKATDIGIGSEGDVVSVQISTPDGVIRTVSPKALEISTENDIVLRLKPAMSVQKK